MTQPIIIEEWRGNKIENMHQGFICVIDEHKNVVYEKGNIDAHVFYRSAMKPIQAIPAFKADLVSEFGLTTEEAALFTASQRGEKYHQSAILSLMNKLQIEEERLVCSPSYPLNEQPKEKYLQNHYLKRKVLHNCAGKHLGFLGYCKVKGYDLSGYEQQTHPLQQEILHYVADLSEWHKESIQTAMDGCGVPVYAVPLRNMAISFLKFVQPNLIKEEDVANAVSEIGTIMNAHPEIVASHNFICTALLKDKNIVAKGGAQGVYCLALRKEKMSIALKVCSGSELVWPILVAKLLEKLKYTNKKTIDRLLRIRSEDILNDSGIPVGKTKVKL